MSGKCENIGKAEMMSIFWGAEDVTISGFTLCQQNLPILATSLPPPSGDFILGWPLEYLSPDT